MSILGHRVLRVEDPRLLTQGGTYLDDLELANAAHVAYVRSPMAHARITAIDTAAAEQAPGVIAVFTAADVDVAPRPAEFGANPAMARPLLAMDTVRFVGEAVAMVVAERRAQAFDAAELVTVEYEPLHALVDPEAALAGGVLLFPDAGTNLVGEFSVGDLDGALDGCEVVVEQRIVNQRVSAAPLETRGAAALWSDEGRLTYWISTQGPHSVRTGIARALDVEPAQVRVIAPDVGGGFGAKVGLMPEELLVAWAARRTGRTVRWTETRSENLLAGGHGRAQIQRIAVGGTREGRIDAYALDLVQDAGAYPMAAAFLPYLTRMMAQGVYDIARVAIRGRIVVTTTAPVISFRGAGRPEAAAAIERAVDLFATRIGMDPAEVRRRNAIAPDAFPYTTRTGRVPGAGDDVNALTTMLMAPAVYDSGAYVAALERLLDAAGYANLRAEQIRRRAAGDAVQLGLGLSLYVEITSLMATPEHAAMAVRPDAHVVVRLGSSPQGQGHATTWAMLVSDRLGVPIDSVEVLFGDTDILAHGNVTGGSRSVQTVGSAVAETADVLVERAREVAGDSLEADPIDIVFDRAQGRFHVAGVPSATRSWQELAAEAAERLSVEHVFEPRGATYPFGAHLALVEVDTETGQVVLRRFVAVDDAGRILNPLAAAGQLHGGIAQGVAQALLESIHYDAEGNLLTTTFADYEIITAAELPDFELISMETPTPLNELGAKGIGEAGTIGATPAVHNAVVDALAHLGVRHLDMPCTPQRVFDAITAARGATTEAAS
ncbi:MAG TPA: xanthine dehydrogenase family protein molybdopterin-binding subunit [Candidatus Dormibacteraeota bacterium]